MRGNLGNSTISGRVVRDGRLDDSDLPGVARQIFVIGEADERQLAIVRRWLLK